MLMCIAACVLATPFHLEIADDPKPAQVEHQGNLTTVTWSGNAGDVILRLPGDLGANGSFTGTVVAEPKGKNAKEKQKNSAVLNGQVVDVGGAKVKVGDGLIKGLVGAAATFTALLSNAKGQSQGQGVVDCATGQQPGDGFALPVLSNGGDPLTIQGPFDGDASNTKATFGGGTLPIIAESQGSCIVQAPSDLAGTSTLEINENGATASGKMRNIVINLSAPRTSLLKGETTQVTLHVMGLEGLDREVPVELICGTPNTVSMQGGPSQMLLITNAMTSGGQFTTSRTLTGLLPGNFSILAKFRWPWSPKYVSWEDIKKPLNAGQWLIFVRGLQAWVKGELAKAGLGANRRSVLEGLQTALKDAEAQMSDPDDIKVRDSKYMVDLWLVKLDVIDILPQIAGAATGATVGGGGWQPKKALIGALKFMLNTGLILGGDAAKKARFKKLVEEIEALEKEMDDAVDSGDTDKQKETEKKIDEKMKEIEKMSGGKTI